jgi:hypothetical protein
LSAALLVWFVLVEAGTQLWYWRHEHTAAAQQPWSLNVAGANPRMTKVEIPAGISGQFNANEALEARGPDEAGNEWHLYYFRWFPSRSLSARVAVQLAKTHGPEKCLPAIGMTMKSDLGVVNVAVGGRTFAFHQYVFLAEDRQIHVFYAIYEDQTGTSVLANRRKNTGSRVAAALAGSRNDGQHFLELVVTGPESAAAAKSALQPELAQLIGKQGRASRLRTKLKFRKQKAETF